MRGMSSSEKAINPASAMRFSAVLVAVGVHQRDDRCAARDSRKGPPAAAPSGRDRRRRAPPRRSRRSRRRPRDSRRRECPPPTPAPASTATVAPSADELLYRFRRRRDARLDRGILLQDGDAHRPLAERQHHEHEPEDHDADERLDRSFRRGRRSRSRRTSEGSSRRQARSRGRRCRKASSDWRIAIVASTPIFVSVDESGERALVRGVVHRRADLDGSGMRVFGHDVPRAAR